MSRTLWVAAAPGVQSQAAPQGASPQESLSYRSNCTCFKRSQDNFLEMQELKKVNWNFQVTLPPSSSRARIQGQVFSRVFLRARPLPKDRSWTLKDLSRRVETRAGEGSGWFPKGSWENSQPQVNSTQLSGGSIPHPEEGGG